MTSSKSREGQVRCLNCFTRFRPSLNAERATCPQCGIDWRISWAHPKLAKIRGPVWEKLREKAKESQPVE